MRRILLLSLLVSGVAWSQITFDAAVTTAQFYQQSPFSWSHTMGGGANCILIALVGRVNNAVTVTGMTYGGAASTGAGTLKIGNPGIQYFYWMNPPAGTATLSGTLSTTSGYAQAMAVSRSYCGVNPGAPIGVTASGGPTTTGSPGISITPTQANSWAIDAIFVGNGSGYANCPPGWGHCVSSRNSETIMSGDIGPINPAAQVTSVWGSNVQDWVMGALTLNPDTACSITTTTLPGGVIGAPYSQAVATNQCGSPSFSVSGGALPGGLALDAGTGVISGTPTTSAGSPFNFTIGVAGSSGSASKPLSIAIANNSCVITSTTLAGGVAGTPYSQALSTANCTSPAFSVSVGALPVGLSLNSGTGLISGTPITAGGSPCHFTIAITDPNGNSSQALSIAIQDSAPVISAYSLAANSPSSVLATWTTQVAASSKVQCGTAPGGPYTTYQTTEVYTAAGGPGAGRTSHSMVIAGLPNNINPTAYYCQVVSRTSTGGAVTSDALPAGTLAPLVSTPIAATASPYTRYNDQFNNSHPRGLPVTGRACNMDTFYLTGWADDGNVYAPGNDTGGCTTGGGSYGYSPGSNIAVFSVQPANLLNISPVNRMTAFSTAGTQNTNGWADGATWKSSNIISVRGNLILPVVRQDGGAGLWANLSLTVSGDHGATWLAPQNYPAGTPRANGDPPTGSGFTGNGMWTGGGAANHCGDIRLAQHAQDYGGASGQFAFTAYGNADAYVYGVCLRGDWGAAILTRVRVEDILLLDVAKYQYYTGGDGLLDANWSSDINSAASLSSLFPYLDGWDFIPDFNRWLFVHRSGSGVGIAEAPYPWGPYTEVARTSRVQAYLNYQPTFSSVVISTYKKISSSPLVSKITVMTTGTDRGAMASDPSADEYSPHWFELSLTTRGSAAPRPVPISYNGGRNAHISRGMDLFYPMQRFNTFSDTVKDFAPGGLYSVTGLSGHPLYDGNGMFDFGYWQGFVYNCSPACDQPAAYTLTTPYDRTLGDFTLALVFAHYPNSLPVNSNETVLDKTDGSGHGLRIFRNGSAPNSWKVTVGSTTSAPFALPTDVPAGNGSFPMLFVRRRGISVTIYTTSGLAALPPAPLASFGDLDAMSADALILGTRAGGAQAFYGTVSHLQIWSRALSDWELVQQAGVVQAAMAERGIITQ